VAFGVAELGAMPLCPHTNTRFFDGTLSGHFWLEGTLELMRRCDAVIFVPGWERSEGSCRERQVAEDSGIPCFDDLEGLGAWLDTKSS